MGNRYRLLQRAPGGAIAALVRLVDSGIAIRQAAFLVARRKAASADGDPTVRLRRAWRSRLGSACLRFDESAADAVLTEAEGVLPRADVLHHVLFPVVAELGDARHADVISISQEHFASGVARRLIAPNQRGSLPSTRRRPIVTACAPGEHHESGLLRPWCCRLREAGRPVVHLGPDVPVDSLLATVDRVKSPAVVVGVTLGRPSSALGSSVGDGSPAVASRLPVHLGWPRFGGRGPPWPGRNRLRLHRRDRRGREGRIKHHLVHGND